MTVVTVASLGEDLEPMQRKVRASAGARGGRGITAVANLRQTAAWRISPGSRAPQRRIRRGSAHLRAPSSSSTPDEFLGGGGSV
jgi:hypothetical protein